MSYKLHLQDSDKSQKLSGNLGSPNFTHFEFSQEYFQFHITKNKGKKRRRRQNKNTRKKFKIFQNIKGS